MKKNSIMVQGTGSSVGKSIMVAGLCRVLMQDGHKVAPFKSQNMALNSFITEEGHEMGRAQVVQAEAAGIRPHVNMNPVLLKPSAEKKAQVIVMGKVLKNMSAVEYHDYKLELKEIVKEAYSDLSDANDFVVIEGAGSPAEINLRDKDIVNMGMAEISDSPVIIVGDIDRGGVFASLYGTVMLLTEEERKRVKGVIINKFRGDVEILKPGLKMLEDLIHMPVLGVVPYVDVKIEDEDSLADRFSKDFNGNKTINIEVLYLPHVSNFTDFNALETQEDVNVRYVMRGESISDPDVLIIPGSKNTIEDLVYLRNSGLEKDILRFARKGKRIVGICGGYQILGEKISDPMFTESSVEDVNGLALLEVETIFEEEKMTTQVSARTMNFEMDLTSEFKSTPVTGYEIHMGKTELKEGAKPFVKIEKRLDETVDTYDGCINENGNIFGTYLHGIFDDMNFTRSFLNSIRREKGLDSIESQVSSFEEFKNQEYDKLAEHLRKHLDMEKIYEILRG